MVRFGRCLRFSSDVLLLVLAVGGCSDEEPANPRVCSSGSATCAQGGAGGSGTTTGSAATSTTASSSAATTGSGATTTSTGGAAGTGGSSAAGGAAGSGGASSGGSAGDVGAGGSTGTGGAPEDAALPCVVGPGPSQLPFAVDKYFIASGWMQPALIHQDTTCVYPPVTTGDGGPSISDAALEADAPATTDATPHLADAATPLPDSKCWTVTYTPTGPGDWAGVDWQYPANNWGSGNGLVIPAGATQVSFYAWGDVGGEKVSFNVGYGTGSSDQFGVSSGDRFLTIAPTRYSIDLTGVAYTCPSVRMGFGWVAAGGTTITFHVADIRWE